MRSKPITVFNVKYRRSGDDYEVASFRTIEQAEAFAKRFLEAFVWNGEWEASSEQLEIYASNNDLAYIDITEHVI